MELKDERPVVVGIGEVVMDCFKEDSQNEDSPKEREELGGAPLIFAYHAAKSHCKGIIVSAIGLEDQDRIDEKGSTMLNELNRLNLWGNSKDYIYEVPNRQSGFVEVNDSDKDNPLYDIKTDAAWADIPWTESLKELAEKTSAIYYGPLASYCGESQKGASKKTIDSFIANVPKGCYKIFDVNLRHNPNEYGEYAEKLYKEELIREYVNGCTVLKANEEEIYYVGWIYGIVEKESDSTVDSDTIGNELMACCPNVEILILTKGKKGSTIFWREKEEKPDTNKIFSQSIHISVEPDNTVGAGDAMVGAFIGELLNGKSKREAHYLAALRSDKVCRAKNSMPPIPGKDFFFSYSKNDNVVVDLFYKKFTENKEYTVFKFKQDILPGEKSRIVIPDAIDNCQVFVYFSSNNANVSENVIWEINEAKNKHKNIIIIKLDDSRYPENLKDLEPIQHERFEMYEKLHDEKYSIFQQLDYIYNKIIEFYKTRPI